MTITPAKLFTLLLNSALLFIFIGLSSFTHLVDTGKTTTFKFKTVVIDAGHGGKDGGAPGSYSTEKTVTLAIAKKLHTALAEEMPGLNIVMTRKDDTFIGLSRRSDIANASNGNLFVSIHCNSSPPGTGPLNKGAEILVYGLHRSKEQYEAIRENASIAFEKDYKTKYAGYDESNPANRIVLNMLLQRYRKQTIIFGELVNNEFKNVNKRRSLGVKEQGVFVLANSAMPAVLVETGYINNLDDEEYLNSEAGQDAIVRSIVRAIKAYKKEMAF